MITEQYLRELEKICEHHKSAYDDHEILLSGGRRDISLLYERTARAVLPELIAEIRRLKNNEQPDKADSDPDTN